MPRAECCAAFQARVDEAQKDIDRASKFLNGGADAAEKAAEKAFKDKVDKANAALKALNKAFQGEGNLQEAKDDYKKAKQAIRDERPNLFRAQRDKNSARRMADLAVENAQLANKALKNCGFDFEIGKRCKETAGTDMAKICCDFTPKIVALAPPLLPPAVPIAPALKAIKKLSGSPKKEEPIRLAMEEITGPPDSGFSNRQDPATERRLRIKFLEDRVKFGPPLNKAEQKELNSLKRKEKDFGATAQITPDPINPTNPFSPLGARPLQIAGAFNKIFNVSETTLTTGQLNVIQGSTDDNEDTGIGSTFTFNV